MELKISHISLHPFVDALEAAELLKEMVKEERPELMILPDFNKDNQYRAVVLEQFYTERLGKLYGVERVWKQPPCMVIEIHGPAIQGFCNRAVRFINPFAPPAQERNSPSDSLQWFLDAQKREKTEPVHPWKEFLQENPPAKIEQTLNEHIMGQEEMTAAVADFLYYHALRQLHPQLPPRPLLITGPSGCGKTEVWRKVSALYGNLFPVKIIDGSSLSCDGWAGSFKVSSFLDDKLIEVGILVVDEFDKLVRPKFSSGGGNVSLDMQAELLKLMEGDYRISEQKKDTGKTTKRMGFVMAGAFQELQQRKEDSSASRHIGFCAQQAAQLSEEAEILENGDFIRYGVMPELMGRIAVRCQVKPLSDQVYLNIIKGPHSRVTQLTKVLEQYGVDVSEMIPDREILELIAQSNQCQTGVRWVSAQVENRILERIREGGLFPVPTAA